MIKEGKLPLTVSDRMFNEIATGISIAGPTSDDLYHITFSVDRVDIISQTVKKVEDQESTYAVSYSEDDSESLRVKVGCCSLPSSAYYGLFASIIDRAITQDKTDILLKILADRGVGQKLPSDYDAGQ